MQATTPGGQIPATLAQPDLSRLSSQFAAPCAHAEFLRRAVSLINAAGGALFRAKGDAAAIVEELLSRQALSWSPHLRQELAASAATALRQQIIQYHRLENVAGAWLIACPFPWPSGQWGCLSLVVLVGASPLESFLVIAQLLAALLARGQHEQTGSDAPAFSGDLQRLTGPLSAILDAESGEESLLLLNEAIRQWAGCTQVALGRLQASERTRLCSLSNVTSIDHRTDQARILDKALQECASQNAVLMWPSQDDSIPSSPILKETADLLKAEQCLAAPLKTPNGVPAGALLLLWETRTNHVPAVTLLESLLPLVAVLVTKHQTSHGYSSSLSQRVSKTWGGVRLRTWYLALAAAGAILTLLPLPFRITADCAVQPSATRYVSARFDGMLKEALVRPGDRVRQGDVLVRLDGREIELQSNSVGAEKDKASKMRDQYMAVGDTAAAQIARLDELRFTGQLKLLEEKLQALTLVSPVNGIVLTGDLKRIEGSPVSKGQTLFEVAPLDKMDMELAIREQDIAHVEPGMNVQVRVAAYPEKTWPGTIDHIVPKSQIKDNRNVFIAKVSQNNPDFKLHPGMHGEAKIQAGWRPLGWQLLRKPWFTLLRVFDQLF